jgi:hypothetical protein
VLPIAAFRSSALRISGALVTAAFAMGCGGDPPPKAAPHHSAALASSVQRYMPLKDDVVYAYRTVAEDTGEQGVLMLHVKRTQADLVELNVGGKVQRLEILKNAIRNLDGGFLLKAPLTLGATWPGTGGQVRVTAVDKAMRVPAGSFVGCVETIEERTLPRGSKRITTDFCPDVGIVQLQVQAQVGSQYAVERAVLRSFGPRIDLGGTEN